MTTINDIEQHVLVTIAGRAGADSRLKAQAISMASCWSIRSSTPEHDLDIKGAQHLTEPSACTARANVASDHAS